MFAHSLFYVYICNNFFSSYFWRKNSRMSEVALIDGFMLTKSWLEDQIERKHGVRPLVGKVSCFIGEAVN